MNAMKLTGVLLSGLSLVALAGCNESNAENARGYSSAKGREVCTEERVTVQKPRKDKDRVLGTVAGAVVGGVVGDKLGGDAATVGGAVAGGYAGNRVQKNMQDDKTETVIERKCRIVYD